MKDEQLGTVYLLHFDPPYKHARHYAGWTANDDPWVRLDVHDAKLVRAAVGAQCTIRVVRVWHGVPRSFERKVKHSYHDRRTGRLHNRSLTHLCPACVHRPTVVAKQPSQLLAHVVVPGQLVLEAA